MSILDTLTAQDFKAQFPRYSPMYLPVYVNGKTYFEGDIVYYNNQFYQCIVTNTADAPTVAESWALSSQQEINYTQDIDILNAYKEAYVNFNEGLFPDDATKKLVFLYLTAHYLTVDFNNAMGIGQLGIPTSKSVGSVSQGFTIPLWLQKSAGLSMYATTGYGVKYASLIRPYLIGNIITVCGRTTYGQ